LLPSANAAILQSSKMAISVLSAAVVTAGYIGRA
jgi:hypothetical protein